MTSSIVLHLPHASTFILEDLRDDFLLSDQEILAELNRITDHATDVIFKQVFPEAKAIVFPVSRLVVDPERFSEDSQESMSQVEMGVTYTREIIASAATGAAQQGKARGVTGAILHSSSPKADRGC